MKSRYLFAVGLLAATPAMANSIDLSTSPTNKDVTWTVSEVSNGKTVTSAPKYIGKLPNGNVEGFTIPFTDNDGFWTATATFDVPKKVTDYRLTVKRIGVDDRCLVAINGQTLDAAGSTMRGRGKLVIYDGGPNRSYTYDFKSGKQGLSKENDVEHKNTITVFVNNTGRGIHGHPVPMSKGGATNFGMEAVLTYTPQS